MATYLVYLSATNCSISGYYYDSSNTYHTFNIRDGGSASYAMSTGTSGILTAAVTSITAASGYQQDNFEWEYDTVGGGTAIQYVTSSGDSISLTRTRTIDIRGIPGSQNYYYRYRWLLTDGTIVSTSPSYYKSSTSGYITVTLSDIPTYGSYKKTGQYTAIQNCTIRASYDYAECNGTSSSPSIIGVYVSDIVDKFYWFGNETTDASNIRQGNTRTMTATMWNSFLSKIEELGRACSSPVSITRVRQDNPMLASQYTAARNALSTIKNSNTIFRTVSLPQEVDSGDGVNASQFQGSTSIKQCLNNLIDRWNA